MFNKDIQSDEELYASWFFEELKQRGYIKEIVYQPQPFKLAEAIRFKYFKPKPIKKDPHRVEEKESNLLEAIEYTPDIKIIWDDSAVGVFITITYPISNKCKLFVAHVDEEIDGFFTYHEVKPIFDDNNMTREVIVKHKWVYQRYGIYVNTFIKEKIMPKLFTPSRYIATQIYKKAYHNKNTGHTHMPGTSKIKWKPVRTIDEYVTSITK